MMKRFLSVLFLFLMIIPFAAHANETDIFKSTIENIQQLSFEELKLIDMVVSQEMARRPEWKSVTVPPGAYQIGVDIPAGYWDISTFMDDDDWYLPSIFIIYCSALDSSKTDYASGSYIKSFSLSSNASTQGIFLESPNFLIIEDHAVIFTPHVQPNLGF